MDDLVAFLRARLTEDEQAAHEALARTTTSRRMIGGEMVTVSTAPPAWRTSAWPADRVLRDVEAKRRIIDLCDTEIQGDTDGAVTASSTLYLLALPYADHSDYQEEWRP